MLFKLIRAERMKLKRSPVWIAFILMPIVPAVMGTINYLGNLDLLNSEWYSLWTQHTLFTCYFFLPIMVGIYCSYIMRLEQNNHNWNKTLTMPVPKSAVFAAKLIITAFMILISEIWIGILFILSGKAIGMVSFRHARRHGNGGSAARYIDADKKLRPPDRDSARRRHIRNGVPGKGSGTHMAVLAHGVWHELKFTAADA